MKFNIELERVKRTHPVYQEIRDRHYIPNNGTHGQQLHYLIWLNFETRRVVGIISGASSVWSVKSRDEFFGLTKENKQKGLPSIINNTVFRLEEHFPNLATQVLSIWRKRIACDWTDRYGVIVHGFETFVIENDTRKGALYSADNWTKLGVTAGSTKCHPSGLVHKSTRLIVVPKLIFAKKYQTPRCQPNTHLHGI